MRPNRPRYRCMLRTAAVKRRRRGVEITAGLVANSDGFFFYRKRNPLTEAASRQPSVSPAAEETVSSCLPLSSPDCHEPESSDEDA